MKAVSLKSPHHSVYTEKGPEAPEEMLKPMDAKDTVPTMKKDAPIILTVYIVLILLGLGTGYLIANHSSGVVSITTKNGAVATTAKVVGVQDASKFSNCPTGKLLAGGLDGEGTHHLERPGGPSQTAYLTSSLIDLDQYVNLTVKVCGETIQAQKAPWLMDVQRLELQ